MVDAWTAGARVDPGRTGLFLDFDGTLAPIVADPAAAAPIPGTGRLLGSLSERYRRVAVISGRPVAYLLGELAGAGATELYGLYGLEHTTVALPDIHTAEEGEIWRPVVADAAAQAQAEVPAGVRVEAKGLTVTLHYRNVPERADWVEHYSGELADGHGLGRHRGKMSFELRPPVRIDKGTVVGDLTSGLTSVLFAGDDLGDLPAFEALVRLRRAGVATLSVASGGTETPAAVIEAADVVVGGPPGVMALLESLLPAS